MQRSYIIVGAGIVGAATALQLAKAGHRVQVIAGSAPSATNAAFGWINASFYHDEDHHRLRAEGIRAWVRLQEDVPVSVEWRGCLCWDMPRDELQATYGRLRDVGYRVDWLDGDALRTKEPNLATPPAQALFFPTEGAAHSADVPQRMLQAAQALGAQVMTNVSVTGICQDPVGVQTQMGTMAADHVIIAAGTGTQALAATASAHIPLKSRPAYIMRTTPQAPLLNHILATPLGELRQEPDGSLLMPIAVGHQGSTDTALSQTPTVAADAAMARLKGLVSGLDTTTWAEVIAADRPVPADDLPVIGEIAENVYAAVLHSGITLGPLVGELIAKDITQNLNNADAAMLAPYRPDRFTQT